MDPILNCECSDGRTVTGAPKWNPEELNAMEPLQLAAVASEQRDFARYYASHFYSPLQRLRKEQDQLLINYRSSRTRCYVTGIAAGVITVLWLLFAIAPALRFSGITLFFALLTLGSILLFIPMLLSFLTAQNDYEKRRPRYRHRAEQLVQKQEQMLFGTYLEYLIGGYLISPDYSLQEDAMDYFVQMLKSRRAANLAEANLLCRKKFGKASIPGIITRIYTPVDAKPIQKPLEQEQPAAQQPPKATACSAPDNTLPELLRMSDELAAALHGYAAAKETASVPHGEVTQEESDFLAEYRSLNAQEQLRIRRIVRSFRTGSI